MIQRLVIKHINGNINNSIITHEIKKGKKDRVTNDEPLHITPYKPFTKTYLCKMFFSLPILGRCFLLIAFGRIRKPKVF